MLSRKMSRRQFIRVGSIGLAGVTMLGVAGCGGSTGSESAEDYPTKELSIIVPYSAGGPTDLAGRSVAQYFEQQLGQTVVVENIAGAAATQGIQQLINSTPDGYTLAVLAMPTSVITPIVENLDYSAKDWSSIGTISEEPSALLVHSDSKWKTAEEFLQEAKDKPGDLSAGTVGANSTYGIELKRMQEEYDIKIANIPFDGNSDINAALLGKQVDAYFSSVGEVALPNVNDGKFVPLFVGTPEKTPLLPDTPTLKELGYEKLTEARSTFILVAPGETPAEIVSKLETTLQEALEDPKVTEQIGKRFIPEEFHFCKRDTKQYKGNRENLRGFLG